MFNLNEENNLHRLGYQCVGGIDEVGRGPLAGPVVAACVVIKEGHKINKDLFSEVNDSKKLSEKKEKNFLI